MTRRRAVTAIVPVLGNRTRLLEAAKSSRADSLLIGLPSATRTRSGSAASADGSDAACALIRIEHVVAADAIATAVSIPGTPPAVRAPWARDSSATVPTPIGGEEVERVTH